MNLNLSVKDRKEQFRQYAVSRSKHQVLVPPILLPGEERRLHIRQTMMEDHEYRIFNNPAGAQGKFEKLANSPFSFFRGTALLFYRDYAGMDSHFPIVFTNGDIHPENFGVMPNKNGVPFFGVNDFDEAAFAPFTYDLKRGAVGFNIGAKVNGIKKKHRKEIIKAFIQGYIKGLQLFTKDDKEKWHEYRLDNSPPIIRNLLQSANRNRKDFLEKKINLSKEKFKASKKVVPISSKIDKFQEVIQEYARQNDIKSRENKESFFIVKDVALKKGSGTASLGLDRYYVLINGPSEDPTDDIILEFKLARRSALYSMIPDQFKENGSSQAETIVQAHNIHLSAGDPFYGTSKFDDKEFVVREKSPFKQEIDLSSLKPKAFIDYACICGEVVAQTHARSDQDTGMKTENMEKEILDSIVPHIFIDDILRFSLKATRQLLKDHKLFIKDHELGVYKLRKKD
ncbi:MAG: DUF2252 domain-containing protein [Candidatus Cyclobacteriaceae bacterium M3_2C_046]